jgi:rhamnosyltransferase
VRSVSGVTASIIIPTRNGLPLVERCLRGVLSQKTSFPFEVVVIDSASTDGTWEFLESFPVRRIRIRAEDFNHGATRNLAAWKAYGEFLVFLVQDAVPADDTWLANLISAFDDPDVVGVYSRQRPRTESNPVTWYMTLGTTPDGDNRRVKRLARHTRMDALQPEEQLELSIFQNNSSGVRRSVFLREAFDSVPYGEDISWGKRMIEAGHALVYEPSSVVLHSHDRSPLYALKRAYADHYQAAGLFGLRMLPSVSRLLRTMAWSSIDCCRYVLARPAPIGQRLRYALAAPVFMIALATGQYLGGAIGSRTAPANHALRRLDQQLRVGV